jgi:hypothetical protein
LRSPPTRFGGKSAEAVSAWGFLGQSAADRGENAPRDEEHNDEEENALHENPATNKMLGGVEYTPPSQFRISDFGFGDARKGDPGLGGGCPRMGLTAGREGDVELWISDLPPRHRETYWEAAIATGIAIDGDTAYLKFEIRNPRRR